ncbi:MAG: hypothetical protein WC385_03500 [Candidatus Paceibacterota bacterium]|jgi:hypothetical protein
MNKAEILRSSREREKKRKNTKRVFGVLLLLFIVGGFLLLLNLNFLRLTTFSISGQTSLDLVALKQTIKGNLDGSCLGIVPNNSVFFFSKTKLATLLKQKFPGLQAVEIDSPNLNTLIVKVSDRESKVLWCNVVNGKICFYLNDEGQVYQEAPNFSESIIMEFDSGGIIKKLPTKAIDPKDLSRAKDFLNFLKPALVDWPRRSLDGGGLASSTASYKLDHINVLPLKDFEAIIVSSINPNNSWKLLFNTGATADQLITNFNTLIKDPTLTKNWPAGTSLDYLDLRFENKAFYKFK